MASPTRATRWPAPWRASTSTLIQREGPGRRAPATRPGPTWPQKWRELAEHPLVGEARSVGLIGALELVQDKGCAAFFDNRARSGTICRDFCFQNGLIMRAVRDTMIISPPLVISREQIDELAEKAWRCLDLTLRPLPRRRSAVDGVAARLGAARLSDCAVRRAEYIASGADSCPASRAAVAISSTGVSPR